MCMLALMPILNVDDNAPSRYLRSRILERAGFEVREADSAEAALRSAAAMTPQLVLLDVALPDGDGFTVCEQLKAAHPHVPVVMITSVYQSAQARRDGFQVGADEYPSGSGGARALGGRGRSVSRPFAAPSHDGAAHDHYG